METPTTANGRQQRFAGISDQHHSSQISHQNNITDDIPDAEDQQVLDSVKDRLASFPLDNMSPTTTVGTALSLATAALAPGGLAADADDDVIRAVDRIPEHPAAESELGVGVSPVSIWRCHDMLLWHSLIRYSTVCCL